MQKHIYDHHYKLNIIIVFVILAAREADTTTNEDGGDNHSVGKGHNKNNNK